MYSPTWQKSSAKEVKEQVENGRRYGIDFIILTTKRFLYRCKFDQSHPSIKAFKFTLNRRYEIERVVNAQDNNQMVFERIWKPYENLFKSLIIQS
ncbi:hypothetical protein PoB_006848500 [Plakobranchus ocellatus]|uniref:Uncharacterized protein n=1 Tax=Plakobranchus ocellatus TaxID=259542 RepID=A0AAV4DD08_9GAST|nr:hypothetical protein PoB_006848500 [Plakobranchus ocellatus]